MHDRPTDDRRNDDGLNDALTDGTTTDDDSLTDDDSFSDDDSLTDDDGARLEPGEVSNNPEDHEVDGITPLPEEITGRASGTDEDLVALFENRTDKHMTDGFRGGSDDEPPVDDEAFDEDPTQVGP